MKTYEITFLVRRTGQETITRNITCKANLIRDAITNCENNFKKEGYNQIRLVEGISV